MPDAQLDDAVQEVFLVVHRRLAEFEGRSSIRTWVFGIPELLARLQQRPALFKRLLENPPAPHEEIYVGGGLYIHAFGGFRTPKAR